jgi:hypothetical protein
MNWSGDKPFRSLPSETFFPSLLVGSRGMAWVEPCPWSDDFEYLLRLIRAMSSGPTS